ncbi:hypothetical protein L3D22_04455 [Lysobacter soli]|uniref:hypothetical protein n=1 Tax=Lysobacter soli TaxID=453783 RepID=UPI0020A07699|nr:hypothetical protein [Lysobacter soli]UTA55095.1 hypothetical protein L3D22_04455 [Lysobacter soli]
MSQPTMRLLKRLVRVASLATALAVVPACGASDPAANEARVLADAAMAEHCASNRAACGSLKFVGSERDADLWLVEYESEACWYVVVVDSMGTTQITRTSYM